ncbi:hypothetical protein D0907_20465 (plasmid) [Pseudoalteromonas lipolytica]|uniref:PRTRC system protein B n=1 Tax=Pseudoalteromonas lipolytica TaxID=570156 RepID=A0AAD0WEQ6_9GAMM|nr:hypothetical protein [Pseudoalteromonas donghaensis]AXV67705.1 hypothetical protein D0907_20465 [Pseudoalteromonas donghaensis]
MNNHTPQVALVFHGQSANNIFCATKHMIDSDGMKLGEYIDVPECIEIMRSQFSPKKIETKTDDLELLPSNVILNNSKALVWHKPSHKGIFWYRSHNAKTEFSIIYPALLFCLEKGKQGEPNGLIVFALPSNQRPNENTHLYHAPLMNIYSNGVVCQGNATLPKKIISIAECMNDVEKTVLASNFTHVNHEKTLKAKGVVTTQNLLAFWSAKANTKSLSNAKVRMRELNRFMRLGEFLSSAL